MIIQFRHRRLIHLFMFLLWPFLVWGSAPLDENGESPSNPSAITAAQGVLSRLLPKHASHFDFVAIPPEDGGRDVFEIESLDDKIILRGNNGVSLCSALNWYLKYYGHADVSWNGIQVNLSEVLPKVPRKIRQVSPHRFRYFFNYCCFGYSMPWWDWEQWEFMIDWMALNGINMPLAVTGQEATWQAVMRQWGVSEKAIQGFLAGPPYLPFGWMGCLDGWGSPLSQDWIDRHAELQKRILARERELGMTPVLQGFTGHVPEAIREKFPDVKLHKIQWIEWNTSFIDPLDPQFGQVGKTFLDQQTRDYGTNHLYAADTFIEMSPPSNDPTFLQTMGKSLSETLTSADPDAVWVMQGWIFYNNAKFWQPPQSKAFLSGVPNDRMILLDLFCDVNPVWNKTESFYGKPWIWCILQNFGNTISLSGPLPRIQAEMQKAMSAPDRGRLSGIGMIQEGLDYNPVVFDFMTEMAWHEPQTVDLEQWIEDYAHRRYGRSLPSAQKAWRLLLEAVYNDTHSPNSIITTRPSFNANETLSPARPSEKLIDAWGELLSCTDSFKEVDTFRFDLVNVTRQILSDLAQDQYSQIKAAYRDKNLERFRAETYDFLQLFNDLDETLATRQEFLLGKWIEDAKRWGNNDEERRTYEWNARNMISLWGDAKSSLHDYARKEWSGLIKGFYQVRWKMFFNRLEKSLVEGTAFDNEAFLQDVQQWEESWTHQDDSYLPRPIGDSIDVAIRMHQKYGKEVK